MTDWVLAERWYVQENDLIGGWCVMNRDYPPSQLDRTKDRMAVMVADLCSEATARYLVATHNAVIEGRIRRVD